MSTPIRYFCKTWYSSIWCDKNFDNQFPKKNLHSEKHGFQISKVFQIFRYRMFLIQYYLRKFYVICGRISSSANQSDHILNTKILHGLQDNRNFRPEIEWPDVIYLKLDYFFNFGSENCICGRKFRLSLKHGFEIFESVSDFERPRRSLFDWSISFEAFLISRIKQWKK